MVIGRTDEWQHSVASNGRQCRRSVWRLFAEPIWASGHVPQHIGRTHDRNRTDQQTPNLKTRLHLTGRPHMEALPPAGVRGQSPSPSLPSRRRAQHLAAQRGEGVDFGLLGAEGGDEADDG